MKKVNIVKESRDFDKVFKAKHQISSRYAFLYTYDTGQTYRFGICVSKKLGNAVTRNKLKRRVKDIIDKSELHFNDKDYIIILKKSTREAEYLELKDDIVNLLRKSNL